MISYSPLFETMKEKNITSYKLEKMGFSRATYYSIQKGNSVSTNTINQLCKLLQCEVSDIIKFVDDDNIKSSWSIIRVKIYSVPSVDDTDFLYS